MGLGLTQKIFMFLGHFVLEYTHVWPKKWVFNTNPFLCGGPNHSSPSILLKLLHYYHCIDLWLIICFGGAPINPWQVLKCTYLILIQCS